MFQHHALSSYALACALLSCCVGLCGAPTVGRRQVAEQGGSLTIIIIITIIIINIITIHIITIIITIIIIIIVIIITTIRYALRCLASPSESRGSAGPLPSKSGRRATCKVSSSGSERLRARAGFAREELGEGEGSHSKAQQTVLEGTKGVPSTGGRK